MSANIFGNILKMMSFGESHGSAMGVVIDGCPSGVLFEIDLLIQNLKSRRPGQSDIVTARNEPDEPVILSGVYKGKTLGTPIAIMVHNTNHRSKDYKNLKDRKGHADQAWKDKFKNVDLRGGGRSSGRETLSRVIAGSVAEMIIKQICPEMKVFGFTRQVFNIELNNDELKKLRQDFLEGKSIDIFASRMPNENKSTQVDNLLRSAKSDGKSYGGLAEIWVKGVPSGLGQPIFNKIKADLASAALSLGAVVGFELGDGRSSILNEGTEFHSKKDDPYGGIQGGITTGQNISFQVSFKPTSSVLDVAKKGRHDPCIVPRAIPVLEAMTYHILADHLLWKRLDNI